MTKKSLLYIPGPLGSFETKEAATFVKNSLKVVATDFLSKFNSLLTDKPMVDVEDVFLEGVPNFFSALHKPLEWFLFSSIFSLKYEPFAFLIRFQLCYVKLYTHQKPSYSHFFEIYIAFYL